MIPGQVNPMQALQALQAQMAAQSYTVPAMPTGYPPLPANAMANAFLPPNHSTPAQPQLTREDVQAMIADAMKQTAAAVQSPLAQFDSIFQRALPEGEFAAFAKYVQAGAPGFAALMQSDKLDPIAQLLWETIKENVK